MDYRDVIVCVRSGRYIEAANYAVKDSFGSAINKISPKKRQKLTIIVAVKLEAKHKTIKSLNQNDFPPDEIAREAYEETVSELGLDDSRIIEL